MMASQIRQETASLLKFGFVFMVVGFLTMGSAYTVNIMVLRMVGLEGTGYYQAAWTLGGLYVGFILEAMGADFYPRLTAINKDNAASNRIVNEQVQVSMLLAGPGAIATLTFSPIVIALFYTTRFGGAVEILRWFCLGMALRMIIWPISFIIIAKGERILFLGADIAWTSVNIGLSWIFLKYFGLNGVGIAFFGAYIFQGLIIYLIVRRLSSFRWSSENKQMGMLFLSSIAVVFLGFYIFPLLWAIVFGTLIMILSCIYSIRVLIRLTSFDMIPGPIQRLLVWFRFVESGS
jgi:PST family polysaccharide transporter